MAQQQPCSESVQARDFRISRQTVYQYFPHAQSDCVPLPQCQGGKVRLTAATGAHSAVPVTVQNSRVKSPLYIATICVEFRKLVTEVATCLQCSSIGIAT